MASSVPTPARHPSRTLTVFLIGYIVLLALGSLVPDSGGWRFPGETEATLFSPEWPRYVARGDVLTNILAYFPLGVLLARWLAYGRNPFVVFFLTALGGLTLSFTLESLQIFVPGRVSSKLDLLSNTVGCFAGALLERLIGNYSFSGRKLFFLRHKWFLPGRLTDLGLMVLGVGFLSQLLPWVPSLAMVPLFDGVPGLWYTLMSPSLFNFKLAAVYLLNLVALGLFTAMLTRAQRKRLALVILLLASAISIKTVAVFVMQRSYIAEAQVSLEGLVALGLGLVVLHNLLRTTRRAQALIATLAIAAAFSISHLGAPAAVVSELPEPFSWIPFQRTMLNLMGGIQLVLYLWPGIAIGFVFIYLAASLFVKSLRPHFRRG